MTGLKMRLVISENTMTRGLKEHKKAFGPQNIADISGWLRKNKTIRANKMIKHI